MNFMNLATIALGIVTAFGMAAPVMATPVRGSFEAHEHLWNTIQSVGVRTYINPNQCRERKADGFYMSSGPILVICQDNGTPGGPQVDWTDNDLDTLRHEAHHLVQDCNKGQLGDNSLAPIFDTQEELSEFLIGAEMTQEQVRRIIRVYGNKGASNDVIIKELEAFAVARSISASSIANAVVAQCSVN